jgi:hypothetical protein
LGVQVDDLVAGGHDPRTHVGATQIHDVHMLDAQAAEVRLDARAQLGRLLGRHEACSFAFGADLADEHEVIGVGVQRFTDESVGHAVAVELGRVDVVDAELDGAAQHPDGRRPIDRTPLSALGELHRTKADAGHRVVRESPADVGLEHRMPPAGIVGAERRRFLRFCPG